MSCACCVAVVNDGLEVVDHGCMERFSFLAMTGFEDSVDWFWVGERLPHEPTVALFGKRNRESAIVGS